jgi:hypothetical protein
MYNLYVQYMAVRWMLPSAGRTGREDLLSAADVHNHAARRRHPAAARPEDGFRRSTAHCVGQQIGQRLRTRRMEERQPGDPRLLPGHAAQR